MYPIETGLYYLTSRYYNPAWGRFINADGFVSTGQGVLGNNMFAYCLNNPVNMADEEGTLACAIIGGLVGGLIGGISSVASGQGFWAGAAQGALSGAIAGGAVDFVLWSGGTGAAALVIVGAGGAAGSFAGDAVYSGMTDSQFDLGKSAIRAGFAGMLNIVSFGFSRFLFNKGDYKMLVDYLFKPTVSDIPGTVMAGNIGTIGAMANGIVDGVHTPSRPTVSFAYSNSSYSQFLGGKGMVKMYA